MTYYIFWSSPSAVPALNAHASRYHEPNQVITGSMFHRLGSQHQE